MFKTDYKNDKLLVAANTKRKYKVINNGDETVSFEDATEYEQRGDTFGAEEINKIMEFLNTTDDFINDMGTVKFDIEVEDWEATGNDTYPYVAIKLNEKYTSTSMPVWCLAATGADGAWTDEDEAANEVITKCVCSNGQIAFYSTEQITTAVKILAKGV